MRNRRRPTDCGCTELDTRSESELLPAHGVCLHPQHPRSGDLPMSGHDPVTTTLRGPHLARYVPPERPRPVPIDGRRITIGCSALEDGRWVPAISVDSAGEGEPRRIYTAGTRHAQPSPT